MRAAFQCDLIRVATFQWSPGTNHVSFKGLYPDQPEAIYMHHPISHFAPGSFLDGPAPTGTTGNDARYHFLCNVQTWYNQKTAEILRDLKTATDAFGGSLLDHTVVPFVTEVSNAEHTRTNKPALIFGGSKLGMRGGQYLNLTARPYNDLWLTLAQAYFGTTTPLDQLSVVRFNAACASVIPGLWAPPA